MIPELVLSAFGGMVGGWFLYRAYLIFGKKRLEQMAKKQIGEGKLSQTTFIYKGKQINLTTAERPYPDPVTLIKKESSNKKEDKIKPKLKPKSKKKNA